MIPTNDQRDTKDLRWFFDCPSGPSRQEVWQWWQERRLRYNRDLFVVGVAAWILVLVAGSEAVKPGDDFEEPMVMIFGPLLYAALANLAYTAGPIIDMLFFRGEASRRLLKAGYVLSLVLTVLPAAWAVAAAF